MARHYGDLDPYYRELWGEHLHHGLWLHGADGPEEAVLALLRHVADRASIRPGDRVCDVGSGYGATARWLVRERQARVTAVTVSPEQHARAVALADGGPGDPEAAGPGRPSGLREGEDPVSPLDSRVRYVLADWLENEESAGTYDAVLAVECLSHLPDVDRGLAEMARVLRPGGCLVACVWLARGGARPWEVRHLLRPICEEGRLAGLLTARELSERVAAAGLEVRGLEDLSRHVAPTWTICLLRAVRRVVADPEARRFLRDRSQPERVFARTLVRLRLAYATGSLRYGVMCAVKNPVARPSADPSSETPHGVGPGEATVAVLT